MSKTCFLLCVLISIVYLISAEDNRPLVTTPLGKILGYRKISLKSNKYFSAFDGIPYAKPPIDDLRFEPPQPIEPWKETRDALKVTDCAQTTMTQSHVALGEEDCLYLNVYVPREEPDPNEKLDVIVHIHGGLFLYGSGHVYSHPEYFMEENVIFINFNYRLGIFGFLSTEDDVVSGNNGLKDQVMALKWIQDNIASFGGNPDSVTITGLSTGASSVHYHYLSDMSVGLFHKGFSQSGVALNYFALQEQPLAKAKRLAESVECPTTTTSDLVKCLKEKPYKELLIRIAFFHGYKFFPVSPFGPVVEKGSNPFLTAHPYDLLTKGKVQDLPWLTSSVTHEGLFPASFLYNDLKEINQKWDTVAPFLLDFNDTLAQALHKTTAEELRTRYFGKKKSIKTDTYLKFVQMFSDRFLLDVETAIKLQSKANKSPVYYYQFAYAGDSKSKTVHHGADAQYFFYKMYDRETNPSKKELKMKDVLMNLLLTFAKTGEPKVLDIQWPAVEYPEITFLNITGFKPNKIQVQTVQELAPRDFWKSLGFLENENLVLIKDEL